MKSISYIIFIVTTLVFVSCKEDNVETRLRAPYAGKTVTLFTSPDALHGQGYSSMYTEALLKFADEKGFRLRILIPSSLEEGQSMIKSSFSMLEYSDDMQRLTEEECNKNINSNFFIIADALYEQTLSDCFNSSDKNEISSHVLLFETVNDTMSCYTFNIEKYAPMYIAGEISSNFSNRIALVTAYPENRELKSAVQGFQDGCDDCGYVSHFETFYLADGIDGFNKPVMAEHLADSLYNSDYMFIMPLAGQSNSGIYNASRNAIFGYTAGMDYNAENESDRVTFNIEVHIDSLVCRYVDAFLNDTLDNMERHARYTLQTGEIGIKSVERYEESISEWITDLWPVAIEREKKYLNLPVKVDKP